MQGGTLPKVVDSPAQALLLRDAGGPWRAAGPAGRMVRLFSRIPLLSRIVAARILAVLALFAVIAGASWVQGRQTLVMRGIVEDNALQSVLLADSQEITNDHSALYLIMAKQAAGGSRADSQQAIAQMLARLDAIKANLTALRLELPLARQAGFDAILTGLAEFRDTIGAVGAMPDIYFGAVANNIQPFEQKYRQITMALNAASRQLAATAAAHAKASAREAALIRELMFAFAIVAVVVITTVERLIVTALRRTVKDICEATEGVAAGRTDFELERLARGGEFDAIVRSLTVFRETQFRIVAMRQEQEAMEAREDASRIHRARQVRMISVLSETNEAILRAETREKLFQLVCEAAASGGNITYTTVVTLQPESGSLRVAAAAGPGLYVSEVLHGEMSPSNSEYPELPEIAIRTGKPCISNDYAAEQQKTTFFGVCQRRGIRSGAALPLFSRGTVMGTIILMSQEPNMFSPDFVELLQRLAGNLCFALENLDKAAERERAEARIKYLATHDSLTGLPNRATFNQLLSFSIANARRYQRRCAVLFIDLDRFKLINDSLGHAAGDTLLVEMAGRLNSVVRGTDVVARLGGDEFMVLLNDVTGPERAIAIAQNLLTSFSRPLNLSGHECRITASIGIAMFPEDGTSEQTLMKNADTAMYLAKTEGKNGVRIFSDDIKTQSVDRLKVETSLQHAVAKGELCLLYQPKLDVNTGRIAGVEALVRWNHPELGLLPPIQFIPLAEETGLIVMIGRWVLNTACAQNMAWQRAGLPPVSMAINVSPRQFSDENLLRDIDDALAVSGMDPRHLQIEITESMVMLNVERAIEVLDAIQSRGVRLAIDDFGTGYSSMSMLKRFPIDTIKIDRSFVRDLPESSEDKAIAQAIISMGKALGLTIVAEGVETIEQDKFLRDHACDEIQGFLFSKPREADAVVELLRALPKSAYEKPCVAEAPQLTVA